jgi:ABC-type branched-subunit amino acid transport system ATPase component/MFS family permease
VNTRARRPAPPSAAKTRLIDEIESIQARLQRSGREAMGVTGDTDTPAFWAALRTHRLGVFPLVALGLLVIIDGFQLSAYVVMGPEISHALGVGRATITLLILLNSLAVTLAALPIAAFVQRRPHRALVAKVTAIGWSLATVTTGLVNNAWQLAGVLTFDGATSGSVRAVHQPLLIDSYPTVLRARVVSAYHAFDRLGAVMSPLLVALLAGPFDLTWRGVFVVMGIACVVTSLVGLPLRDPGFGRFDTSQLRDTVREEVGSAGEGVDRSQYELRFYEIVRRLLMIPTMRRVLVSSAVLGMLLAPLNGYFTFFLEERWHLDPPARAVFFALIPVFAIAGITILSRFNEQLFRSDPSRLFHLGAALQAGAVVLVALAILAPKFGLMVLFFGLASATIASIAPALATGYLSIIRPHMRPHAAALVGIFTVGVGGFAGLSLLSGLDTRYGVTTAIASVVLIFGFISSLVLYSAGGLVNHDLDRTVADLIEEEELQAMESRGEKLPMLACRKIDFSYGQLQVLFGVDMTVDDGEMVALLGTNGAGKSTLLRVISGLGLPSRGSVRFRGGDITFLEAPRRVRLGITQVPSGRAVFAPMNVVENLRMFGYTHGRNRAEIERGLDTAFDCFPILADRRDQRASTLSGGEQQMLGLSKAFILNPRLLLVDELSLGLAPKIVSELLEMLRRINQGGTAVVLVEQSVNVALSVVDHAYFMERGEIRFDGRARDLLKRRDLLRSVFLEGAAKGLARTAK